jgi:Aspartyl protease/PDZ domain
MKEPHYSVLFLLALAAPLTAQTQLSGFNAAKVVDRWRAAVHSGKARQSAVITTVSMEDGIPGTVQESISDEVYRCEIQRTVDESQVLLTKQRQERRDWNGWVRKVEGRELERFVTGVDEERIIIFGPPKQMESAELLESSDHSAYVLRYKREPGWTTTWYVDATTYLPLKSVRPGDDSEITTTYSDWRNASGLTTPFHAVVTETDKPDYSWDRKTVQYQSTLSKDTFAPLVPGPPDVVLAAHAPPIPFTMEANHIVFNVSVNGRPPIGFILDTGADQNVINSTHLEEFGVKTYAKSATTGGGNSAEYDYASGATFTLPGVEVRNQHVAAIDQTGLERALGVKFGGILGYDFISRFVMEIDYQNHLITLHDPGKWKYSGVGVTVPVVFDNGIPHAFGSIGVPTKPEIRAYFAVDFGAAETATLTSPFVNSNDLTRLAQTNATVNRPTGLENQFFAQNNVRGHLERLTIGGLTVKNVPVNMSVNTKGAYASANFSGTVGETIYSRYHCYLDYPNYRIILEPTPEADKPFPGRETYGLTLLASGTDLHTYTVTAVRPGSPAESDGFQKGDLISGKDGKKASEFTLRELRDSVSHAGEHHALEVQRSGELRTTNVEVRLVSIEH